MRMRFFFSFALLAAAARQTAALVLPVETSLQRPVTPRQSLPFNQIVAFGDELSDNGNGSSAHGIAGDPETIYGFSTWTNGPVAVSYLAGLYDVPLVDYAWGGCCGGSSFGATIDNRYVPSEAEWNGSPVPSLFNQIHDNYSLGTTDFSDTLQFVWVGQNDLTKRTDAFWLDDPQNTEFAANITDQVLLEAEYLIVNGAPYVVVPNIYPKHLAPVTITYLCPDGGCVDTWGEVITQANTALKTALANSPYSSQLIYYDVFDFMVNLMDDKDSYGFTTPLGWICDGGGNANWTACISGDTTWAGAYTYYWMNFIQPTTRVHQMVAEDMKNTIDSFIGLA